MSAHVTEFRKQAAEAIGNAQLQKAIDTATGNFWQGREGALEELPDSDALRDHFKAIRHRTLGQLREHLETFEEKATRAGAQVHWAKDGEEARRIIVEIGRKHGVTLATKGKSMAAEEIHLNEALEEFKAARA